MSTRRHLHSFAASDCHTTGLLGTVRVMMAPVRQRKAEARSANPSVLRNRFAIVRLDEHGEHGRLALSSALERVRKRQEMRSGWLSFEAFGWVGWGRGRATKAHERQERTRPALAPLFAHLILLAEQHPPKR